MPNYTSDMDYAIEKLKDSVILHKGKLQWVIGRYDDKKLILIPVGSFQETVCPLEDIDLTPAKLGYVNYNLYTYYVQRLPVRHWRQGFREATLRGKCSHEKALKNLQVSQKLQQPIQGNYPKIENVIENVYNEEKRSQSFCTKWGLNNHNFKNTKVKGDTLNLEYKGINVGHLNLKKDEFNLYGKYQVLEEVLEECVC